MNKFDHNSGEHLEIAGAKIYFEMHGTENSPALLFLHGGFGTMEDFNHIVSKLAKEYRIVGIDSRGQGKSTLGKEILTYERMQRDVERVLVYLGIEKLSIIGFSDGGITAYRLASFSALKIEKLVTISSRWHIKNTEFAKDFLAKVTGESWQAKFPETFEIYQKLNAEPDFDFLAESLVKLWLDESSSGYPNEAVKNIPCPLLIVRGDDDHLISKETVFELSEIIETAHLLNIPFAGHAAFVEQKEIFINSLNQFLKL